MKGPTQELWGGRKIHIHASLPSTNVEAKRLARMGASHGEAVIAYEQTAGRGRRGRDWLGLPGEQLFLSVILRPDLLPSEAPRLVSLASVAVAEGLSSLGVDATIKWPNDIEVGGKKVCGILTELSADVGSIHFVVLGVGVNLEGSTGDLPEDLRERATTLEAETGKRITREEAAKSILQRLDAWLATLEADGFEAVRRRYVELSAVLGQQVRLFEQERTVEGVAEGVDAEGALLVRTDRGGIERFLTGDVTSLRRK